MVRSLQTLSIFTRVFIAFAITTAISVAVITLLSHYYFNALVARDQAVKVSFAAAATANDQLVNLQRMNALLRTRLAQVFATTGGSIRDPSLQASGGLIAIDILTREIAVDQTLARYQQTYTLATSSTMSGVRAIVFSDDPQSRIGIDQDAALSEVASREWPTYRALQDQVLQLLDPATNPTLLSNPPHAYEQAYALEFEANVRFLGLKNDWQRVVDSSSAIGEIVTNVGPSQTQPILVATSLALVCTILIIVLTGSTVNLTITRPLRQLAALTRRIASGETQARAPVRGRDEIALVAGSMNTMLDHIVRLMHEAQSRHALLHRQVEQLVHEVSGVAQGNLRIQAAVDASELGVLAESINYMVGALSSLVIRVKLVAHEVVRATVQTSGHMDHLVQSAGQHIAQIRAAAEDVERMAAASQRVAQRVQDLSSVAQQAHETARQGASSVQQTVGGMGRIAEHVLATAQKVQVLQERSAAITDIGAFMSTIAHTTTRLALDASIQAQLAGEGGKGFAEIAASIRHLAEQAKEQATQIAHIVRTVRQDMAQVHLAMRETTRETERGTQLTRQTGAALASILAAVQRQADEMVTINQVALDQVQVSAAVVQVMRFVSESTQRGSAHTQQAARYLQHEGHLVAQLRSSVEVFKVREEPMRASRAGVVVEEERGSATAVSGPLAPSNIPARAGARLLHTRVPTRITWQQRPEE